MDSKIEVQIDRAARDRFQTLCEQQGLSMSALLRGFILRSLPSDDNLAAKLGVSQADWEALTAIAKTHGLSPEGQICVWIKRAIAARHLT